MLIPIGHGLDSEIEPFWTHLRIHDSSPGISETHCKGDVISFEDSTKKGAPKDTASHADIDTHVLSANQFDAKMSLVEQLKAGQVDFSNPETSRRLLSESEDCDQAGGHGRLRRLVSTGRSGRNGSSLVLKPSNSTEDDFYKKLPTDQSLRDMRRFFPENYGSFEYPSCSAGQRHSDEKELERVLVLEDCFEHLENTDSLDLKLGNALAEPGSKARIRQIRKNKKRTYPVRMAGMIKHLFSNEKMLRLGKKDRITFSDGDSKGQFSLAGTLPVILPGPEDYLGSQDTMHRLSCLRSRNTELSRNTSACWSSENTHPRDNLDRMGMSAYEWRTEREKLRDGYTRGLKAWTTALDAVSDMEEVVEEAEGWRFPGLSLLIGCGRDPNDPTGPYQIITKLIDPAYAYRRPGTGCDWEVVTALRVVKTHLHSGIESIKQEMFERLGTAAATAVFQEIRQMNVSKVQTLIRDGSKNLDVKTEVIEGEYSEGGASESEDKCPDLVADLSETECSVPQSDDDMLAPPRSDSKADFSAGAKRDHNITSTAGEVEARPMDYHTLQSWINRAFPATFASQSPSKSGKSTNDKLCGIGSQFESVDSVLSAS